MLCQAGFRKASPKREILDWRPSKVRKCGDLQKVFGGIRHSECKGPEARKCPLGPRDGEEA